MYEDGCLTGNESNAFAFPAKFFDLGMHSMSVPCGLYGRNLIKARPHNVNAISPWFIEYGLEVGDAISKISDFEEVFLNMLQVLTFQPYSMKVGCPDDIAVSFLMHRNPEMKGEASHNTPRSFFPVAGCKTLSDVFDIGSAFWGQYFCKTSCAIPIASAIMFCDRCGYGIS